MMTDYYDRGLMINGLDRAMSKVLMVLDRQNRKEG